MLTQENVTVTGMKDHPVDENDGNSCDLTAKARETDCAQTNSTGDQFAKELNYQDTHNEEDDVQTNQEVDEKASTQQHRKRLRKPGATQPGFPNCHRLTVTAHCIASSSA